MIQYAKLHQKDVISVIIPNFFSSLTVYSYLRLSVVRFQFMSGLVLFATHFGLTTDGLFILAFRKAPLWLRCRGRSWLALYRLSLTLSLQTRCDAERSGKCGEHREDYLYNGLPFFLFHSDCPFFSD